MLKVGLTGGIASGKSVVGEMFARLGAHVTQADVIAHELMQPGEAVYAEVVRRFGRGILHSDGSISRPKLAELAFGTGQNPSRIEELNRIVHPAVIARQDQWMESVGREQADAVTIVEAALILEAGAADRFDRLVVVTCKPEQRIERWMTRMNVDRETAKNEVNRRMSAQLPDEEKINKADYGIDNSGSLDATERQVRSVYAKLAGEAAEKVSPNQKIRTGN
ncbi:MAG TPA: dephospho-CoA kinase [Terriglobales bacterium]|nr:dephospho-CoA kinase [Terriglobales bacterium]